MANLTDTQLIILSGAAARDDGVGSRPPKMSKATAAKIGAGLIDRKLVREVPAKAGMPVWREDEEGRSIAVVITAKGRKVIGVEDGQQTPSEAVVANTTSTNANTAKNNRPKKNGVAPRKLSTSVPAGDAGEVGTPLPRAGSKQALVIEMLRADGGATIDALVEATDWLPHTTRAALTGLRKRGFTVERSRGDEGPSTYRISEPSSAPESLKRSEQPAGELAASA